MIFFIAYIVFGAMNLSKYGVSMLIKYNLTYFCIILLDFFSGLADTNIYVKFI